MYYVVAPDGQRYGPADVAQLSIWSREGRIASNTILLDATTGAQIEVSQVPGLMVSPQTVINPGPPQMPQYGWQPGPQAGAYPTPYGVQPISAAGYPVYPATAQATGIASLYAGRLNRARYFGFSLAVGVVTGFVLSTMMGTGVVDPSAPFASPLYWLLLLMEEVILSPLIVRRLHDINRPSSHYWLLLVPLYNIYLGLCLLFEKGPTGSNAFGPDPLAPPPGYPLGQGAR